MTVNSVLQATVLHPSQTMQAEFTAKNVMTTALPALVTEKFVHNVRLGKLVN